MGERGFEGRGHHNRRREGAPWRGGHQGGPAKRPVDDRQELRFRLIKLGDKTEKLVSNLRETASGVDSFLKSDRDVFRYPSLAEVTAVADAADILPEDKNAPHMYGRWLMAPEHLDDAILGGNTVFFLELLVEVAASLPHKHSYYSCLIWCLLHESAKLEPAGTSFEDLVSEALAKRGEQGVSKRDDSIKGEQKTIRIKGEIIDDDHEVTTSIPPSLPPTREKGERGAKDELGSPYRSEQRGRDTLFYIRVAAAFVQRLWRFILTTVKSEGGLHKTVQVENAIRVLADLVNLNLLKPTDFIGLCRHILQEGVRRCKSEQKKLWPSGEYLFGLSGSSLLWLGRSVYEQHRESFADFITSFSEANACRRPMALERAATIRKWGTETTDELDDLEQALIGHAQASGRSKVIPRLYDSAKLTDFRLLPLVLHLNLSLDVASEFGSLGVDSSSSMQMNEGDQDLHGWIRFAQHPFDVPLKTYRHAMERDSLLTPAVTKGTNTNIYQLPKSDLQWKEGVYPALSRSVLSDSYVNTNLDVESLTLHDLFTMRKYIRSTIRMFYTDTERCAVNMLLIPVKHDQFNLAVTDGVFRVAFLSSTTPIPKPITQGTMISSFLAQLLHKLALLESPLVPHIHEAFRRFFSFIDTWSEEMFHQMVVLTSTWMTYNSAYNDAIVDIFSHLRGVEVEEPRQARHRNLTDPITTWKTPLERFISHVCARVQLLIQDDIFLTRIPPAMRALVPVVQDAGLTPLSFSSREPIPERVRDQPMLASNLNEPAPLESLILRDLLPLQVSGPRETQVRIHEALAYLRGLIGRPLIRDATRLTHEELESLIFPFTKQEDDSGIKRKREEDAPTSVKRARHDESVIKTEVTIDDAVTGSAEDVVMANDGPTRTVKTEENVESPMGADTSTSQLEVEPSSRLADTLDNLVERFDPSTGVWDAKTVTRMISMTFLIVGEKTLSHNQRCLDLYSPILRIWTAETGENSELFEIIWDSWGSTNNWSRQRNTLFMFMIRGLIDPTHIPRLLFSEIGQTHPLILTVGGDYVFWPLIETTVAICGSGLRNVDDLSGIKISPIGPVNPVPCLIQLLELSVEFVGRLSPEDVVTSAALKKKADRVAHILGDFARGQGETVPLEGLESSLANTTVPAAAEIVQSILSILRNY